MVEDPPIDQYDHLLTGLITFEPFPPDGSKGGSGPDALFHSVQAKGLFRGTHSGPLFRTPFGALLSPYEPL